MSRTCLLARLHAYPVGVQDYNSVVETIEVSVLKSASPLKLHNSKVPRIYSKFVPRSFSPKLVSCASSRAAVPVSLLEESHGSFHRRMLERMRIAHLDTRKCTSMDASRCIGATTLVKSSPARVTLHEPDCLSSSRSEQSKRAEAEHVSVGDAGGIGTTECAPRESNIKSAGGGLGVRKATGDQTRLKKRIRAHTLPTTSKDCDNATTTATLVRNPFSPDKRRRLTTNTTQYLRWASSCSIVHDARQDTWVGIFSADSIRAMCSIVVYLYDNGGCF